MFSFVDLDIINFLWIALIGSWLVVNSFWLLTMQRALEAAGPLRKMQPGNVWLAFIPLFGLYWQFAVVQRVGESLGEEYVRRGIIPKERRPGNSAGLTANILLCCAFIPTFGILVAIFSHISRIIHLVRIKNYTSELEEIIRQQIQYAQTPGPPLDLREYSHPKAEEDLKRNNPERFMPPVTPEQERLRWGRK